MLRHFEKNIKIAALIIFPFLLSPSVFLDTPATTNDETKGNTWMMSFPGRFWGLMYFLHSVYFSHKHLSIPSWMEVSTMRIIQCSLAYVIKYIHIYIHIHTYIYTFICTYILNMNIIAVYAKCFIHIYIYIYIHVYPHLDSDHHKNCIISSLFLMTWSLFP